MRNPFFKVLDLSQIVYWKYDPFWTKPKISEKAFRKVMFGSIFWEKEKNI